MKKKRILILAICLYVTVVILLVCGFIISQVNKQEKQQDIESLRDLLKTYQTTAETQAPEESDAASETIETMEAVGPEITEQPEESTPSAEEETSPPETETDVPETEAADAALDFEAMWQTNPDICAWIEIDGTKVDYPVLQSPDNDKKYLTTAVDGSYYIGGSLFTEATYNSRDFNDPVTIIYGHTMRSGILFGELQSTYASSKGFAEHSEIKLHLPDEVRCYTVFAAVPYSRIHILDTYDFSVEYWYKNFFKGISDIREFGAQFNRDITPEPGDRVLILSTCLNEDSTRRYLILAIHQDDIS